MGQPEGSKGLPEGSEGLPGGSEGQPEGSEGQVIGFARGKVFLSGFVANRSRDRK